jgi:hypothetical protein
MAIGRQVGGWEMTEPQSSRVGIAYAYEATRSGARTLQPPYARESVIK